MLIYTHQKSKKRKPTAKQKELAAEWQDLVNRTKTVSFAQKPLQKVNIAQNLSPKPFVRETPRYPSLNSNEYNCFKPIQGKVYTGDKMKGIGTLHKSNAVPIFTDEEAKDQAAMRR
jgi:hypothetical protein